MHPLIRRSAMAVPGLNVAYCWARKRFHEIRTAGDARHYFTDYAAYRDALVYRNGGLCDLRTSDGLTITVRRNQWDARVLQEIFLIQPYTRNLSIAPGGTVVDIGGYIGDFALYAMKRLHARRVIVYEPSPRNFELLERNVVQNGYQHTVVAVQQGVSDRREVYMNLDLPDHKQVNVSAYAHPASSVVTCVTLAELMERHDIATIDLLKIDCEGGEYAILLGTPDDAFRRIRTIVFEFHDIDGFRPLLADVRAKLTHLGYAVTQHDGDIVSAVAQPTVAPRG